MLISASTLFNCVALGLCIIRIESVSLSVYASGGA